MPSLELMAAFFAAAAIYAYMPGPAMLYAAAQTLGHGRRAGLMAALGIHLGGYVHVLAAALGLSALFAAVPVLYLAVKLLGAAYLVILGLRLLCRRGALRLGEATPARATRRAFAESVAVEVLNPKTALFFIAFLPQFTDASATLPLWAQLLILGTLVNAIFTAADLVCVCMAGVIVRRLRSSDRLRLWAQRLGGGLLIGLGARLALQRG
ncbi:threonine/homoserine/homoserine lactone efflux protein [Ancylobacter aquaticus]|uniref:Threonine/homoserine/homoserine lactone efflux protein n=1 Tax=Ancylobacter aquaticus TaxID=100 RepID=A0A4R1I167_ANCAQ|nr:LysE family translocator [Ancylobacter aquaticus]TCK28917.1 threonine/homoserine/homoserine lactone efflux protein [Ancylobacter aquaticus]